VILPDLYHNQLAASDIRALLQRGVGREMSAYWLEARPCRFTISESAGGEELQKAHD
jgi:hypothetical protein